MIQYPGKYCNTTETLCKCTDLHNADLDQLWYTSMLIEYFVILKLYLQSLVSAMSDIGFAASYTWFVCEK